MRKFKKHITSEEEKKLIGHLVKKKKLKRHNVYFNKKVNGQVKYLSGKFYSEKNKETYIYRSSYELKCFLNLEQDPLVDSYLSEAFPIPYIDSKKKKRNYIPDIVVLYSDGSMCIWEIKPEEMLKDIDVQLKAATCQSFLRTNYPDKSIGYKFITEKVLFKTPKEYAIFLSSVKNKDYSK